jgi:transcriptional regulator with XRE-family HTH domain
MAQSPQNQPVTPVPPVEPLGARIRRLRGVRGIGQERLAIEAHVDQSGLSKFERGSDNRGIGEAALQRLAEGLGISFEELINGTDYKAR